SVARLAGGVAHDFNNLLQVIMAEAERLDSGRGAPSSAREILNAAERAEKITRQLLLFSRGQHDPTEAVELDVAIAESAPLLTRLLQLGTELVVDTNAPGFIAPITRAKLDQILLGLVTSGHEAMPEGGLVTIETRITEDASGTQGSLIVRDNGAGIEGGSSKG